MNIKSSQGVSLIELMIAIALGLLILLGLTTLYLSSQKSTKLQSAIANIEENARLAFSSLRETISHAGYPAYDGKDITKAFHTLEDGNINTSKKCRDGITKLTLPPSIKTKKSQDNGTKDRIVIKYLADSTDNPRGRLFVDCLNKDKIQPQCSADADHGMYNPMEAFVYSAYYITNNSLICAGSTNTVPQPIAENITNIQFLYGIKESSGVRYISATELDTLKHWEAVISVQVSILVRSYDQVLDSKEARQFTLLDKTITKRDRYLYRVFTTSINLPNINKNNYE